MKTNDDNKYFRIRNADLLVENNLVENDLIKNLENKI